MLTSDLLHELDARFPFANAADWDPVGLQIGGPARPVGSVGVAHEVTEDVVAAVIDAGMSTLVSYHPLLLTPTNTLVDGPTASGRTLRLAQAGVSLITVHTAFDAANPGTGDHLLASLGWRTAGRWGSERPDESDAIGRYATVEPMSPAELCNHVTAVLGPRVRCTAGGDAIGVVAVIPGSGSSFLSDAEDFADAVITGDVSHHRARGAADNGLMVVDAGHSATEFAGIQALYAAVDEIVDEAVFVGDDPTPWEG